MQSTLRKIQASKNVALVAHDHRKKDLLAWATQHKASLAQHKLFGTGTTGHMMATHTGMEVECLLSGPMGGDQQLGALISTGQIDVLIFFWDPLDAVPHDPDVKALLRLATVWNIPVATNAATADFIMASTLMNDSYDADIPDYQGYIKERLS